MYKTCRIVLLNLNGQAAGMLIGVSVGDIIAAMTLVPIYIIPTLLFSGFFKDLNTVPGWLRWISVVSPFNVLIIKSSILTH